MLQRGESGQAMKKLLPYKRVLLKLSGEILQGSQPFGINQEACYSIAESIKNLRDAGLEVGVVIGGGNIFRGTSLRFKGFQRTPIDQVGMLATLMNGVALQQALEAIQCPAKVLTALECPRVAETYTWSKALDYLSSGHVLVFVGGTGKRRTSVTSAIACASSAGVSLGWLTDARFASLRAHNACRRGRR